MNRTPPIDVRRALRREVGFGCPVPGCNNPYLRWHHFDPPWRVEEHHRPEGMIALCGEHHDKADAGAFTSEYLQQLKAQARQNTAEVRGRFDWYRQDLLAIVGGNFYYETPIIFQFQGHPIIWFTRDEEHHLLLNVRMLTTSGEPRLHMEESYWILRGEPSDVECPPSGRYLHVAYPNGDNLMVEFFNLQDPSELIKRHSEAPALAVDLSFPIAAVEVQTRVAGTGIEFGPRETAVFSLGMRNCFASHCGAAIVL